MPTVTVSELMTPVNSEVSDITGSVVQHHKKFRNLASTVNAWAIATRRFVECGRLNIVTTGRGQTRNRGKNDSCAERERIAEEHEGCRERPAVVLGRNWDLVLKRFPRRGAQAPDERGQVPADSRF